MLSGVYPLRHLIQQLTVLQYNTLSSSLMYYFEIYQAISQ